MPTWTGSQKPAHHAPRTGSSGRFVITRLARSRPGVPFRVGMQLTKMEIAFTVCPICLVTPEIAIRRRRQRTKMNVSPARRLHLIPNRDDCRSMGALPDFLKPLEYLTRPFPREAVEAAIARREESMPFLLDALDWAERHPDEANDSEPPYMLHLFALFLLAQFREPRAYAPIVRLARSPNLEELVGDLVTEGFSGILASVCDGDTSLIEQLIEDEAVEEFVRASALGALATLVLCGLKPKDELSAYFGSLFRKLTREPNHVWDGLTYTCVDLGLIEHLGEIRKLYEEDILDPFSLPLEEVEAEIVLPGDPELRHPAGRYELIDDAVAEFEGWHCFDPNAEVDDDDNDFSEEEDFLSLDVTSNALPYIREAPKIGRNDPCPCGSGKKFKKCCGGTVA